MALATGTRLPAGQNNLSPAVLTGPAAAHSLPYWTSQPGIEQMLTFPMLLLLAILAVALVLIATERVRADLVALLVAIMLGVSGLVTPQDTFSGLSRSAVITLIAIYILTHALVRTGVTKTIGLYMFRLSGSSLRRMTIVSMLGAALLSLVMNNIAAAAVILPAVMEMSRRARHSPSKLLMGVAFGTLLGGMATLLTTSNIIVSSALRDQNLEPFHLLDFAPVGVPIVIVGILYMVFIGQRLLPAGNPIVKSLPEYDDGQLAELYALPERLHEGRVLSGSPLIGMTLTQSGIGADLGVAVLSIARNGHDTPAPARDELLRLNDVLLIIGRPERVAQLRERGIEVRTEVHRHARLSSDRIGIVEVMVPPRSSIIGRSLKDIRFREKYGLTAVALWREARSMRTDVGTLPLQVGDALLMQGPRERIKLLHADTDFLLLHLDTSEVQRTDKAKIAALIMLATLGVAAFNLLPTAEAMMGGALLMVLTGCLGMDDAYRAIEWRSVFLVAGMLPLGLAMTHTGTAALLAGGLAGLLAGFGGTVLAMGLFLLTMVLVQFMSGQVASVVLAPIALSAAASTGADPRAMAMVVALACSMAFLSPVMAPGGYTFKDFLKVGLPLTILLFITIFLFLPLFWRL